MEKDGLVYKLTGIRVGKHIIPIKEDVTIPPDRIYIVSGDQRVEVKIPEVQSE